MVPSLITLRRLMTNRAPESLFQGDELPIEVPVANNAHSVFACPILKVFFEEKLTSYGVKQVLMLEGSGFIY